MNEKFVLGYILDEIKDNTRAVQVFTDMSAAIHYVKKRESLLLSYNETPVTVVLVYENDILDPSSFGFLTDKWEVIRTMRLQDFMEEAESK